MKLTEEKTATPTSTSARGTSTSSASVSTVVYARSQPCSTSTGSINDAGSAATNSAIGRRSTTGRSSTSCNTSSTGVLNDAVQLFTVRNGASEVGGTRARRVDGSRTEGDVPGLVTAEIRELGTLELAVEKAVEFSVLGGLLTVRNLKAVGLKLKV
jgi:hypothetical protein